MLDEHLSLLSYQAAGVSSFRSQRDARGPLQLTDLRRAFSFFGRVKCLSTQHVIGAARPFNVKKMTLPPIRPRGKKSAFAFGVGRP